METNTKYEYATYCVWLDFLGYIKHQLKVFFVHTMIRLKI